VTGITFSPEVGRKAILIAVPRYAVLPVENPVFCIRESAGPRRCEGRHTRQGRSQGTQAGNGMKDPWLSRRHRRLVFRGLKALFPPLSRRSLAGARAWPLPSQRLQHFGRRHHLAHMPLRMIGHVDERAANRGRQLLAAYPAKRVEIGRRQYPHPRSRIRK
jgi:hypothetical protein